MEKTYLNSLADQAKLLIDQLENGNSTDAMQTIETLQKARDWGLYQEIGKLTRSLHDAIVNFQIDIENPQQTEDQERSAMSDASTRLNYVIELTENAANKTMDMVEDTIPISNELGETATRLKVEWEKLIKRQMSVEEFKSLYREIDGFLDFASMKTGEIGGNLSNILMAQDYQDLTGQVIKRVIFLVQDVEDRLVELVKMASNVETITGISHEPERRHVDPGDALVGEGPVIEPEKRDDVVSGQDEVDDLLSSLGF